jgi:HEAT repeat protein
MYHERAGVRTLVVDRLVARGFNHPKTIPTLVDVVLNDPDSNPRFMAAMVLHRFGSDPRVVEALVHVMKNDPDDDVRAEALSSLDRLGLIEG